MVTNKDVKRILVVDDDYGSAKTLELNLKMANYDVITAYNGRDAILVANQYKPHIIILDIRMPPPDGFAVCEELKQSTDTRDIPIIFLTAFPDKEIIGRARKLGGRFFLSKPYDFEILLELMEKALSLKDDPDKSE